MGLTLLVSLLPQGSVWAEEEEPDRAALIEAGRATIGRLQREFASWSVIFGSESDRTRFVSDVVSAPGMWRLTLSTETAGRRKELNRIIARDGFWYVQNPSGKPEKSRPYEAPFGNPNFYVHVACAMPRFVGQEDAPADLGAFEKIESGVAIYRSPLAGPQRPLLERQAQLNDLRERFQAARQRFGSRSGRFPGRPVLPSRPIAPFSEQGPESSRNRIARGLTTRIEIASGMLVEYGRAVARVRLAGFRWLDHVDSREFAVDGQAWLDRASDPTHGDTNDLVMIGSSGIWRSGGSTLTDGRLLDLWSGMIRRIPFHGPIVIPGCFLKDRTRVAVAGLDPTTGVQGLYEVNLHTGANRRLGGSLLATGVSFNPAASPDGRLLAVIHHGPSAPASQSRVCLVDLTTGHASAIGEPGDYARPTWLPDGRGLLLCVAQPGNTPGRKTNTIARMGLDGEVTTILEGQFPTLLGDGKTLLFRDASDGTWKTCDLNGSDVTRYADGLPDYTLPAISVDGLRLLMLRLHVSKGPEPTILLLGASEGEPATMLGGYWSNPTWR